MSTITTPSTSTAVRIKAEFGYYPGTHHAPKDGYLMDHPEYDHRTGKTSSRPLEFSSVSAAYSHLTNSEPSDPDAMFCEHDGEGRFSVGGRYECSHGQHSRPVFTIVSAKSGRCNRSIIAECERLKALS